MANGRVAAFAGTYDLGDGTLVHRIGYGAMQLSGPGIFGPPADRSEAVRLLRRAISLGINHIDTSDYYGPWVVNEIIADALHPYPEDLVVATKIGSYRDEKANWVPLVDPESLKAQVFDNLRRLKLEALDLVYLRYTEPQSRPGSVEATRVPWEEQLAALVELRERGLLRHIGVSNVSLDQYRRAQRVTRVAAVQNLYNLIDRASADLLTATAQDGVAFVPYFPLGSGFAPSKARDAEHLEAIARRHGMTQPQVSLAWLLSHSPNVLLIPGTSAVHHLEENTTAATLRLLDDEIAGLDEVMPEGGRQG